MDCVPPMCNVDIGQLVSDLLCGKQTTTYALTIIHFLQQSLSLREKAHGIRMKMAKHRSPYLPIEREAAAEAIFCRKQQIMLLTTTVNEIRAACALLQLSHSPLPPHVHCNILTQ